MLASDELQRREWVAAQSVLHPGGNPRASLKSIFLICHPILVEFEWELTKEIIDLPLSWQASKVAFCKATVHKWRVAGGGEPAGRGQQWDGVGGQTRAGEAWRARPHHRGPGH